MLARLRARGLTDSPLFAALERISDGTSSPEEAQQPAAPTVTPPAPALRQEVPNPARLVPSITSRAEFVEPSTVPALRIVQTSEEAVRTLTACLDDAPCRESARRIFRALFEIGLEVARAQGHSASVTRAVFHLPAELLMAHLGLKKSAFYDNLRYLRTAGLVACDAHMGDLRGKSVATGTLWAVSLQPERVLTKQAAPARIRREDWDRKWRDLNRDVRQGRTVYNLLNKPAPSAALDDAGESTTYKQLVDIKDLREWAITPLSQLTTDTLTLRPDAAGAKNVVWALGDAANVKRHERAAIVDRQARALASAFGDGERSLGFWRKLIWNITRGIDAGVSLADDVGAVLARVLGDVQHDITAGGTPPKKPAAVVNAGLSRAGLLDQLRAWEFRAVGSRPAAA